MGSSKTQPPKNAARWERQKGGKVLASTRIFDLRRERFKHPGRAKARDFFVVDSPDWVNVIAVTTGGRMVLVRQFRFGVDDFCLEIPGGIIEPGEDPVAAGVRELREETGYTGKRARLIGFAHPNPAFMNNRCHFVLVEDCKRAAATEWDADEEIEVFTAPVLGVFELALSGVITHALVLDALLHFMPCWFGSDKTNASAGEKKRKARDAR
jgi:8-oxo-dGTP pyrophosphatase MutT (NUDIX family)